MKNKTKKIIKRFFAWLYVGAMCIPLFVLGGYFVSNVASKGQSSILAQADVGVTTPSAQLVDIGTSFNMSCVETFFAFYGRVKCTDTNRYINVLTEFNSVYNSRTYSYIASDLDFLDYKFGALSNIDFMSLMDFDAFNYNYSVGWVLFVNLYLNYLINMSLILFMPEILMLFICWCRDLIYSMTDKEGGF